MIVVVEESHSTIAISSAAKLASTRNRFGKAKAEELGKSEA
jgi:hypothetical protein